MGVKLTLTANGHSGRFRYGKDQRRRFTLRTFSKPEAQRRADRLQTVALELAVCGLSIEAERMLTAGAEAESKAEFEAVMKAAEKTLRDAAKANPAMRTLKRVVTFEDFANRWLSGELHEQWPDHIRLKRAGTVKIDRHRFNVLFKAVGRVPIDSFGLEAAEKAMAALPEGLKPSARRPYAVLICTLLRFAVYPCKLIETYPLPKGFLPSNRTATAFSYLYPTEDAQLLGCTELPLERRVLYGLLGREGLRFSEAMGLTWRDVDLERGVIRLDENKTDDPRAWVLNEFVKEALAIWKPKRAAVGKHLFAADSERMAELFRQDLKEAGVDRPVLFEKSPNRTPIRLHDLRATFITLSLASEKTETWVADRTGHKSTQQISRYRRAARMAAELGLGELGDMAALIPELAKQREGRDRNPGTEDGTENAGDSER